MRRYRMECQACTAVSIIAIVTEPEDGIPQDDEDFNFYCPVCSSAEPSVEISEAE